jgi:hypothetical protein
VAVQVQNRKKDSKVVRIIENKTLAGEKKKWCFFG